MSNQDRREYDEQMLQRVAEQVRDRCASWEGIGARDVEMVLQFAQKAAPACPTLTDKQITEIWNETVGRHDGWHLTFARALERAGRSYAA